MTDWREIESRVFMTTGRRMPVVIVRGEGTRVWDDQGKGYLDFFGGIAVTSLGHAHPALVRAIAEQARTLIHVSNVVYTVPQLQLAQLLVDNSCFDRVYFANSGAEVNEAAIKLARKWGREKKDGAFEVVTADGSFHGRTLAAVTATGTPRYSEPFGPLPPGFVHIRYDDIEALQQATTPRTAAVMLETIQGENGVVMPKPGYLRAVRRWCDEHRILLVLDEVQTGVCRTGPLFSYEDEGIEPDVITLAKGLAGGVPIGAILAKEHCAVFTPGDHGSTFGGNPLATAAGYAVVKHLLENDFPTRVRQVGGYLASKLEALRPRLPAVREVRGRGLLLAVEFDRDIAERVTMECLGSGLIVNNVRPNAVRLAPPLTVSEAEVDEAVAILEGVIGREAGAK
jgi:acetylornithine aminotransferase/acetylornithine/N-succinyldiaminopimelate aminotransferase